VTSHTARCRVDWDVRDPPARQWVCGILPSTVGGRVFSIPLLKMGQYFKAVNVTKKEVVCPWCLGGVAKLIEWAVNPWGAVFTLLFAQERRQRGR